MQRQQKSTGFEHFMMKEIYEQPKAIRDTLNSVVKDGVIDFTDIDLTEEEIKKYSRFTLLRADLHGMSE